MTYAAKLIDRLGGARTLARLIDKSPSTVASWKARGTIPDEFKQVIWIAANKAGVALSASDLLPFDTQVVTSQKLTSRLACSVSLDCCKCEECSLKIQGNEVSDV